MGSESPPPLPGVLTETLYTVEGVIELVGTVAVNWVLLENEVASEFPFSQIAEFAVKLLPLTVSRYPELAAVSEALLRRGAVVGTARSQTPRPRVPARRILAPRCRFRLEMFTSGNPDAKGYQEAPPSELLKTEDSVAR